MLTHELQLLFISLNKQYDLLGKIAQINLALFYPSDFSPKKAHPCAKALRLKIRTKPYTNTLPASMNKTSEINSHKVFVSNNNICLEHNENIIIKIPIKEIKMIGEYTNDLGPFLEDWYLSLYYGESEYFEFSMNTNEIMDMLSDLSEILNTEILPSFFSSTDWKSQILFPQKHKGNPIWKRKKRESKSIIGRLKSVFGLNKYELIMTKEANEIIGITSR